MCVFVPEDEGIEEGLGVLVPRGVLDRAGQTSYVCRISLKSCGSSNDERQPISHMWGALGRRKIILLLFSRPGVR